MPTQPQPNIGEIKCPFTGERAFIRQGRTGSYRLFIYGQFAGAIFLKSKPGQDWLLEHGTFYESPKPNPKKKSVKHYERKTPPKSVVVGNGHLEIVDTPRPARFRLPDPLI